MRRRRFPVGITAHHQTLGERQLVPGLARRDVQMNMEHALERGLAVVDDDVVAVGVQFGCAGLPDALPDAGQVATVDGGVSVRSTVCFLGMTSVCPRTMGRMSRIAR